MFCLLTNFFYLSGLLRHLGNKGRVNIICTTEAKLLSFLTVI